MCRLMGIHHTRTVGYHIQSYGFAEVARRQLFAQLKTLHLECPGLHPLTRMWRVIQAYHNLRVPSRNSFQQILFGRHFIEHGLPRETLGEGGSCEELIANAYVTLRIFMVNAQRRSLRR